jgi:NAD(P)-dependent dehydrogenase (short-subunit alcohol dehydrogenase family)
LSAPAVISSPRCSRDQPGYGESKLCDVLLAFAVARRWEEVKSNALEPGWVAAKWAALQRRTIFIRAV